MGFCLRGQGLVPRDLNLQLRGGSGGNFSLLLAVYGAQPSPSPCQHRGGPGGSVLGWATKQRHLVFVVVV